MSNTLSQTVSFMPGDYRIGVTHRMIYDVYRNKFYNKILKECKNKICAEVGFGTGILTSIALHHGAKHIYAYEKDPDIFRLGSEILNNMGLSDKVTLINDNYSGKTDVDIVYHEIVDKALWGEGLAEVVNLTRRKSGYLLPSKISCNIHFTKNIPVQDKKYEFSTTGLEHIDLIYNKAFRKTIKSDNHICYHNIDKNNLIPRLQLGGYSYDLNYDTIPEYIKTDIIIPENGFIWCDYYMNDMRLMDGHWRADKVLRKFESGSFTFIQDTKDGSWWLE